VLQLSATNDSAGPLLLPTNDKDKGIEILNSG
jgi:hypothetical protein